MTVHALGASVRNATHRIPHVHKIAVMRPSAVGDFIFAMPALHALRRAYPEAEIVYLGRSWHAEFLRGRPGPVDRVCVVPPVPGMGADAAGHDPSSIEHFVAEMRDERFDLALQMFGGGRHSNPFIRRLGARCAIGFKAEDADPPDRWLYYAPLRNERLRLLELAELAGAPATQLEERLTLRPEDVQEALASCPVTGPLVLQPGATDPRRCWPPECFAALGDALASPGLEVVVHGSAEEAPLVRRVCQAMRRPALDLAGCLTLNGLAGLLARACLVVSNDTGPLHLAHALGTPSIGIYWFTNAFVSAPLHMTHHRQAISMQFVCPDCGADNRLQRCAHNPSFVDDVTVDEVLQLALGLLQNSREERTGPQSLDAAGRSRS